MRVLGLSTCRKWPRREEMSEKEDEELPMIRKTVVVRHKWLQWRWRGLNVFVLVILMGVALLTGEHHVSASEGVEQLSARVENLGEVASTKVMAGRQGIIEVNSWIPILSFCFVFVVGVTTGLWWSGLQIISRVETAEPPSSPPSSTTLGEVRNRQIARASSVGTLRQFTLAEIVEITGHFKELIGRGGQGTVYSAQLLEGRGKAAVKKLQKHETNLMLRDNPVSDHNQEEMERAFWAELKIISKLHHRNLVALLGYCIEKDDLFLVYEYMGKGSLSQYLHPKPHEEERSLDWKERMRCAVDVAQGLEYLHNHANPSLVHRDIKSGNILFDDEMNAKIADFGLSKPVLMEHEASMSIRLRGTYGYVDPVYLLNGRPCSKNDVYSYGVVLLELITGRRALEKKGNVNLVQWCRETLGTYDNLIRQPTCIADPRIVMDISYDQLSEVVKLALSCVHERQDSRPSMQDVVAALYNAKAMDDSSSTEFPLPHVPSSIRNGGSIHDGSSMGTPRTHASLDWSLPYEIKDNCISVKCTIAGSRVVLRCKIWPTSKNFGLNKVEASLNDAFLWKKGLWFFNAKSSRDFTVGDDIKVIAEWHVALRTKWDTLPANDPRRNQGPFCVEYLALKDENGPLAEYHGDKSEWRELEFQERRQRRESSGSGSSSVERWRSSSHHRRHS